MKAIDAMFVWTPNRADWGDKPGAGTVEVTTIPEPQALKKHPMSAGACDHDWKEADDLGRLAIATRLFSQMVLRDEVPEERARVIFAQVDEFRGHHFVADEALLAEASD